MIRHVRITEITATMVEQLLSPAGLPAGNYTIKARQAEMSGRYEVFVDGAPTRAGLTRAGMVRVASSLRDAFTREYL